LLLRRGLLGQLLVLSALQWKEKSRLTVMSHGLAERLADAHNDSGEDILIA